MNFSETAERLSIGATFTSQFGLGVCRRLCL